MSDKLETPNQSRFPDRDRCLRLAQFERMQHSIIRTERWIWDRLAKNSVPVVKESPVWSVDGEAKTRLRTYAERQLTRGGLRTALRPETPGLGSSSLKK